MKKVLKVIGIILGILVILGLIFFIVDYNKVKNNEKPMFCILKTEVNDGGTKIYLGLGYKVIDFHTLAGFDDVKIGTWFMKYEDFEKEMEDFETKIIIESDCIGGDELKEYIEIKGAEAEELEQIFKNLKFTTETCDGLDDYNITFLKNNISYGIEIYTNCHITAEGKEAILNAEDSYKLIEIINHHKNNAVNSNTNEANLEKVKFIRTYNIKSDLKETDQTGKYKFYVVDQYQMNELTLIKIDKKYKLEEKSNYEFTFEGVKREKEDYSIQEIFTDFEIVDIKKTDKEGMNQRQDAI